MGYGPFGMSGVSLPGVAVSVPGSRAPACAAVRDGRSRRSTMGHAHGRRPSRRVRHPYGPMVPRCSGVRSAVRAGKAPCGRGGRAPASLDGAPGGQPPGGPGRAVVYGADMARGVRAAGRRSACTGRWRAAAVARRPVWMGVVGAPALLDGPSRAASGWAPPGRRVRGGHGPVVPWRRVVRRPVRAGNQPPQSLLGLPDRREALALDHAEC
jgi:hypothetical protein